MTLPPSFIGSGNPCVRYPLQPPVTAPATAEARRRRTAFHDMSDLPRSGQIDRDVQGYPDGADEVPEHPPEPHRASRRASRRQRADREHPERCEANDDVQRVKGSEGIEHGRVWTTAGNEPGAPEFDPDHRLQREEERAEAGAQAEPDRSPAVPPDGMGANRERDRRARPGDHG